MSDSVNSLDFQSTYIKQGVNWQALNHKLETDSHFDLLGWNSCSQHLYLMHIQSPLAVIPVPICWHGLPPITSLDSRPSVSVPGNNSLHERPVQQRKCILCPTSRRGVHYTWGLSASPFVRLHFSSHVFDRWNAEHNSGSWREEAEGSKLPGF